MPSTSVLLQLEICLLFVPPWDPFTTPGRAGRAVGGTGTRALSLHKAQKPKLLLTKEINMTVGDVPWLGTESQMNKRPLPA